MKNIFYLSFYLRLFLLMVFLGSVTGLRAQLTDTTFFRDDFNGSDFGTTWQAHPSWSVFDGSAYNFIDGYGGTLKTTESFPQTSYIIVSAARGFVANYYLEFRLTFGQADLNSDALYVLRYTAYLGGRLTLSKSTDNVYFPEKLDEVAVFPELNIDTWYKFKIAKYTSGLIQVYIDKGSGYGDTPLLEAIDTSYSALGHLGWQVDTETSAEDFYVDWISARKPAIDKPAIREKPEDDDLITQVSAISGKAYKVSKLVPGVKQLIDRAYTITSVPQYLNGASFIQTANGDKSNMQEDFLSFFINESAVLYVAFDSRATAIPAWLTSWTKTGDVIGTSDVNAGGLTVYSKLVDGLLYPFPTVLGGNFASPAAGAATNYIVAAVRRPRLDPLEAEMALLSGAIVESNHLNYSGTGFVNFINPADDYLEWTIQVNIPGLYSLGITFANASFRERTLEVTDNGMPAGTATFPSFSTSWSSWAFHGGPQIFLLPGEHKIRLTATGTSGPNVDKLSLYYVSSSPSFTADIPLSLSRGAAQQNNFREQPSELSFRAFPNPFLQSTTVYYKVKQTSKVLLSVYTLQGQQIQVLVNGIRKAGSYQATFNAGKYARGIYLYRLQTGNEVKTGKLIKE